MVTVCLTRHVTGPGYFMCHVCLGSKAVSVDFMFVSCTKLRGLSPRANYTDRAAAAGRRS